MPLLRRVRGSLKTGLTWAVVWGLIGAVLAPLFPTKVTAGSESYMELVSMCGILSGIFGFLAGSIFAAFVMFAGRRRSIEELSVLRFGTWSVFASLLYTFPTVLFIVTERHTGWDFASVAVLVGGAVLCAGSSVGSLLLAQRGARLETSRNARELVAAHNTGVPTNKMPALNSSLSE